MPTYTTLPKTADLMQNKTAAFIIVDVSDDIDLGYFWHKASGNAAGKLKVTLVKNDGSTTVEKLAEDGEVFLVNTSPPQIKVLVLPEDLDQLLNLKLYAEFKIDDSWVQADVVVLKVVDDPIPS